jgi:hypothetical protein
VRLSPPSASRVPKPCSATSPSGLASIQHTPDQRDLRTLQTVGCGFDSHATHKSSVHELLPSGQRLTVGFAVRRRPSWPYPRHSPLLADELPFQAHDGVDGAVVVAEDHRYPVQVRIDVEVGRSSWAAAGMPEDAPVTEDEVLESVTGEPLARASGLFRWRHGHLAAGDQFGERGVQQPV